MNYNRKLISRINGKQRLKTDILVNSHFNIKFKKRYSLYIIFSLYLLSTINYLVQRIYSIENCDVINIIMNILTLKIAFAKINIGFNIR